MGDTATRFDLPRCSAMMTSVQVCVRVCTCVCMCVCVCVCVCVLQVGVAALTDWLQHMTWRSQLNWWRPETPTVVLTSSQQGRSRTLLAELSVLQALTVEAKTAEHCRIVLGGWPVTHNIMRALKKLPTWAHRLSFQSCTFPLDASEYTHLTECIPTSYTEWCFDSACTFSVLYSICSGVNEHRKGSEGAPLRLAWSKHEGGDERVGKCVVLVQDKETK